MITLFSTGCPKCKILKQKLDDANLNYMMGDVQEVIDKGFTSAPILKTDDDSYLEYMDAVKWLRSVL